MNKIYRNIMKYFWWIVLIIILVMIYAVALYVAIEVPKEGLEPFIILNLGILCLIPHGIQRLRSIINGEACSEELKQEQPDKPEPKLKYRVKFCIYLIISFILCILLGLFLPVFTRTELIGIFVSVILVFLILDFFYDFLPRKLGLDE